MRLLNMIGKRKSDRQNSNKSSRPDEMQREFWQYRRVWVATIVVLVAARFILPHIPLLKGWEQKLASASIELGKMDVPNEAIKASTIESVNAAFKPQYEIPVGLGNFVGPLLVAAWKCSPLKAEGLCLRYLWNNEPLTLVVAFHPKKVGKNNGPFARTGWGGYYIVDTTFAAVAVGPYDSRDVLGAWPFATEFASHNQKK